MGKAYLLAEYRQPAIRHAIIKKLLNNPTIQAGGFITNAELIKELGLGDDPGYISAYLSEMGKNEKGRNGIITYESHNRRGSVNEYQYNPLVSIPPDQFERDFDTIKNGYDRRGEVLKEIYYCMYKHSQDNPGTALNVVDVIAILKSDSNSVIHQYGESRHQFTITTALKHLKDKECIQIGEYEGLSKSKISLTKEQQAALTELDGILSSYSEGTTKFTEDGLAEVKSILGLTDIWKDWSNPNFSGSKLWWWDYLQNRPYEQALKARQLLEKAYDASHATNKQGHKIDTFIIETLENNHDGISTNQVLRLLRSATDLKLIGRKSMWQMLDKLRGEGLIESVEGNNELVWKLKAKKINASSLAKVLAAV